MSFVNKEVHIDDFLKRLCKRLEAGDRPNNALIFCESFLQNGLVEAIKNQPGLISDWDGRVNAGDFDVIYPLAASVLHDAASRNFSEHSDTYKNAHAVSVAFCEELNELFQCSGEEKYELIPIKSFVSMMAEAGMVKVEGEIVNLTPEGVEAAQSVEREIKKGRS